jgi:predicted O-methyltransferase YrrM
VNTLDYIVKKYKLDLKQKLPIEIPNFGRDGLAGLFAELGFKKGVEIGTERGIYAEIISRANPKATLYCVDPWAAYEGYRDITKVSEAEAIYAEAKKRLSAYPNCQIIRNFSAKALPKFKDASLDFVYIDGNHEYPFITQDLIEWSKKVRVGGIIAGHDYVTSNQPVPRNQVYHAVNGFMAAYNINPWFVLGRKAEVPGEIRDKPRSFMWIK